MSPHALDELAKALSSSELSSTTLADGTGVLVDLNGMTVLTFNETGMTLVNRMRSGSRSLEELVSAVVQEFQTDEQTARLDVERFLGRLEAALAPSEGGRGSENRTPA